MAKTAHDKEFENIMNAFAETVAEMSDEEILAEARDEGRDPNEAASRVRRLLLKAIQDFRHRNLRSAEKEHRAAVEALRQPKVALPLAPGRRRTLLAAVLAKKPAMNRALTVRHREFSQLTDVEVDDYLRQFAALGVLDDVSDEES